MIVASGEALRDADADRQAVRRYLKERIARWREIHAEADGRLALWEGFWRHEQCIIRPTREGDING
jgi:hypothetical protein